MTNSIIAIKGNYLDRQGEIFEPFKYEDSKQDKEFDYLDDLYAYLFANYFDHSSNDIALRGIWFDNDWTIVCDPETVDVFNDEALLKLSDKLNAEVLTFIIQTTSNSFGFTKYNLSKQRGFFSSGGDVTENTGLPMIEELGLNINEQIFVDDIIGLAKKFGINFDKNHKQNFMAKQLDYNDELKAEFQHFKSTQKQMSTASPKPWWKFW